MIGRHGDNMNPQGARVTVRCLGGGGAKDWQVSSWHLHDFTGKHPTQSTLLSYTEVERKLLLQYPTQVITTDTRWVTVLRPPCMTFWCVDSIFKVILVKNARIDAAHAIHISVLHCCLCLFDTITEGVKVFFVKGLNKYFMHVWRNR